MKLINDNQCVVGKYYLKYSADLDYKRFLIYQYYSIFSCETYSMCNEYVEPNEVRTSFNSANSHLWFTNSNPVHEISLTFELNDEEIYKHITMELVINNL